MEAAQEAPSAAEQLLNGTIALNETTKPELTEAQAGTAIIVFYLILVNPSPLFDALCFCFLGFTCMGLFQCLSFA